MALSGLNYWRVVVLKGEKTWERTHQLQFYNISSDENRLEYFKIIGVLLC